MKKIFLSGLAALAISACGSDDDGASTRTPELQSEESPPVTPKHLKIDPTLKPKFVKACESAMATEGTAVKRLYTTLLETTSKATCGAAFDVVASKRALSLGTGNTNSLAPLAFFPFVERLEIVGPLAQEKAELAKLKNLQVLSISFSDVTDLTFLTSLPYLSKLAVAGTPVANVAPLAKLENLRSFAFESLQNATGKETLPKDEAHCPVLSVRKAVNDACKYHRGIK